MSSTLISVIGSSDLLNFLCSFLQIQQICNLDSAIANKNLRKIFTSTVRTVVLEGSASRKLNLEELRWLLSRRIRLQCLVFNDLDRDISVIKSVCPEIRSDEYFKSMLTEINFAYCQHISEHSVIDIIKRCSKLTSLWLSCSNITDAAIFVVAKECPNLEDLNISSTRVTDLGLHALSQSCKKLRKIRCAYCTLLTDDSIVYLCNNNRLLEEMDLQYCRKISDSSIAMITKNLTGLKVLNVTCCIRLTDASMAVLATGCPLLETLAISAHHAFTSIGLSLFRERYRLGHLDLQLENHCCHI
jgi:hypothetical protein